MKMTSVFLLCLIASSAFAVDVTDFENLELLAMDSEDAFDDVDVLFE